MENENMTNVEEEIELEAPEAPEEDPVSDAPEVPAGDAPEAPVDDTPEAPAVDTPEKPEVNGLDGDTYDPDDFTIDPSVFDNLDYPDTEVSDEFIDTFMKEAGPDKDGKLSGKRGPLSALTSFPFLNDAIRIMAGLICLVFSRMNFVPPIMSGVLIALAVVLCGLPVAIGAVRDIMSGKYVSARLIIALAAIASAIFGWSVDAVFVLILADIGFTVRDRYIKWFSDEAALASGGKFSDSEKGIVTGYVDLIDRYFTPVMAVIAVIVALVAFVFAGSTEMTDWVRRALIILTIACPLLIYAVSAVIFGFGKGSAMKKGILFSDAGSIRSASTVSAVMFNKTGGVTDGTYRISGIHPTKLSDNQLLYLAAYAEAYSDHPIAQTIRAYAGVNVDTSRIVRHREEKGSGVIVQLDGSTIVTLGNLELMERLGVSGELVPGPGVCTYVAVGKTLVGRIDFDMFPRDGAREAVSALKKSGVSSVSLITGDNTLAATGLGREVGINEIYADCTPKDKYDRIKYIMGSHAADDGLAFVRGAKNDVEAASLANVRIVLGEAAAEPGSIVIPSAKPELIAVALAEAKTITRRALIAAIVLLAVKVVSLVLSIFGFYFMTLAVLLDILAAVGMAAWGMLAVAEKKK